MRTSVQAPRERLHPTTETVRGRSEEVPAPRGLAMAVTHPAVAAAGAQAVAARARIRGWPLLCLACDMRRTVETETQRCFRTPAAAWVGGGPSLRSVRACGRRLAGVRGTVSTQLRRIARGSGARPLCCSGGCR